jgi:enolase
VRALIESVHAREILDSRGNPTIAVTVSLDSGVRAWSAVPSGASTGRHEAVEKRDGDQCRYKGKGVLKPVRIVNNFISPQLKGQDPTRQAQIDKFMIDLDATPDKSELGANAILGVSQAVARAAAASAGLPLYAYLGGAAATHLPVPMMNIINGGQHADSGLDIQEFMIVPRGARTFREALRFGAETFHTLQELLHTQGQSTSVGDEGGFAPHLSRNEEACELIVTAIERAGYRPGEDIAIALDSAASSFFSDGKYRMKRSSHDEMTAAQMIDLYRGWQQKYPIVSIEDGLAESDWNGFHEMTAALGGSTQIVGDDILVTNPVYIKRATKEHGCNAALIKLNQIGTVTETIEAIQLCRQAGWGYIVSHRSGETEDCFIADFAVALSGGQIKTGSLCRSERIAKYNRLLEIEEELGTSAVFGV